MSEAFKVGDRVEWTNSVHNVVNEGDAGTIVGFGRHNGDPLVVMDHPGAYGELSTAGESVLHHWRAAPDHLRLIGPRSPSVGRCPMKATVMAWLDRCSDWQRGQLLGMMLGGAATALFVAAVTRRCAGNRLNGELVVRESTSPPTLRLLP